MDNCTTFILLFDDIAFDCGEIEILLHMCAIGNLKDLPSAIPQYPGDSQKIV